MDADGRNQTRLTNNPANELHRLVARWDKDCVATNRDGNLEVYVMNSDGSNQVRLTNDSQAITTPPGHLMER